MIAFRVFCKNIKKSFDTEFKDNMEHIERYTRVFNDEITLAHRARMDASTKHIQELVGAISLDNADIAKRIDGQSAYGKLDYGFVVLIVRKMGKLFILTELT